MGTSEDSPQCGGGDDIGSGVSTEAEKSLQNCDEPRPVVFFLKAVVVSVIEGRSALHDQRRAVATAFRSSTLVIFLERDQQKIDDRTAKYLCPEPVTVSSATLRSSTWDPSWLAGKQGGVLVLRRSHDGSPICHLRAFMHNMCGGNSTPAAWEVASCTQTAHGSPATG